MDAIFETFGDWIAYKVAVGIGIRGPESDQEVVFVCPEETHINKLVRSLSPRFHDRVVVVRIPRSALDNPAEAFPSGDGDVDGWKVQLKHVSGAPHRIIGIIDEFNGSNTTVKAIIKILQQFDVRPDVYVPVLNRVPGAAEALPLPVRSLYEIPSPRVPLD